MARRDLTHAPAAADNHRRPCVSRFLVAAVTLASACGTDPPSDAIRAAQPRLDAAVEDAFTFARERLDATAADIRARHPQDFASFYPTSTETRGEAIGQWQLEPSWDWRSGFFPGALWQMYRRTGDAAYLEGARAWSEPIAELSEDDIDYDIGNRFTTTFGLGYRLSSDSDDPDGAYRARARELILTAAATLDRRFDRRGIPVGALRAVNTYMAPYPVYIDGMMNLELLFLGWDVTSSLIYGDYFLIEAMNRYRAIRAGRPL